MQTYATCRILKEMGHEVELIDLRQPEPIRLRQLIFIPRFIRFHQFFKRFYPQKTKNFKTLQRLQSANLKYDCLLVGSDQTWNPLISKKQCLAYFLDFGESKLRRISYASSFGVKDWPKSYQSLLPRINELLHRFNSISVREETGRQILSSNFGLDSCVVLDPTMLHKSYDEITSKIVANNRIICYLLNRNQEQLAMARFLSDNLGIKARMIFNGYPLRGFEYYYPPAVKGWIEQIGGADIVVTDSFHGLVFSLLYHRQIVVIPINNGLSSRLLDLLHLVQLDNRVFYNLADLEKNINLVATPIDYEKVDKILEQYRDRSISYLRDALN